MYSYSDYYVPGNILVAIANVSSFGPHNNRASIQT